eukprot:4011449-Lingulodinium_polyedra.AAC.1
MEARRCGADLRRVEPEQARQLDVAAQRAADIDDVHSVRRVCLEEDAGPEQTRLAADQLESRQRGCVL